MPTDPRRSPARTDEDARAALCDPLVRAVRREARRIMAAGKGSHGFDHVERVLALALRLGAESGAELRELALAALLHDVGRAQEDHGGGACHAEAGAALAREILMRHGAGERLARRVAQNVRRHRFRGAARPVSREEKLLFDADKLDSLGAVGVGRAFLFAGEIGARLHNSPAAARRAKAHGRGDTAFREWLVKLRHLPGRLLTPAGRRLAAERASFAAEFFRRLDDEVAGRR
jgi:uncharacterized protein